MAEVIAGTAILGVGGAVNWVNNLWSYNRENWSFDRDQQQASMHQQQSMRIARYSQFREDMRDLFELTNRKVDTYLTATTLQLGFVISLFYDGRLPGGGGTAPNPQPSWLVTLYGLTLSASGMFLILSIYLSINAMIQAQSFSARILTQHLRLPVPTDQDVWNCASRYKEYESSGTQMRIPYVSTAGKRVYNAFKRTFREDETEEPAAPNPTEQMGAARIRMRRSFGEGREILTHRFMDVEQTYGAALGPPQLVAEDRYGRILSVSKLPHIRMFRNMQDHWQPYDAYSRVAMVLGTIMLCISVCHYNTLWYLRFANEVNFSVCLTSAFSTVSVCLLFLEVSFDTEWEKSLACFFLIGSAVFSYVCAIADSAVLWQKVNKDTSTETEYWSLEAGLAFQRWFTPVVFFCHLGFMCCYAQCAQPLDLPGFIRQLPHRFRNVRVIDVFAPMHSETNRRLKSVLKLRKPYEKLCCNNGSEGLDSPDPTPSSGSRARPPTSFLDGLAHAIELRERIGLRLARCFQDTNARNQKPMADLAVRFQKDCMVLTELIPSNYPHVPVLIDDSPEDDGELQREVRILTEEFGRIVNDLKIQSQNFNQDESHRLAQDILNKKNEPEPPSRIMSNIPFSNRGVAGKMNKYLGIDAQYNEPGGNMSRKDSIDVLPALARAPWDPPRAHKLFFYCMIVTLFLHLCAFVWIMYRSISDDRLGQSNNLMQSGKTIILTDNGLVSTTPPPPIRRLRAVPSYGDRMSPHNGAQLFGCVSDDLYFGTYLDIMKYPRTEGAPDVSMSCGLDTTYDALAVLSRHIYVAFESNIFACESLKKDAVRRLPPNARITAFDFYDKEHIVAALDHGGVVLLEKDSTGWVSKRVLWDRTNVTSIAVHRDGALQMVSGGRVFDADLFGEPYRLKTSPRICDECPFPVKGIASCPDGPALIQTERSWRYFQRSADQ